MARRNIIIGLCTAVFVLLGGYLLWQARSANEQPLKQADSVSESHPIGIVDMRKALKSHPKYEAVTDLKSQRSAEAMALEAASRYTVGSGVSAAIDPTDGLTDALLQKRDQLIRGKYDEANKRLQEHEQKLREQYEALHRDKIKAVDDQYLPEIFNLQLKLDTLQLTPEAAQNIHQQILKLRAEQSEQLNSIHNLYRQDISQEMQKIQETELQSINEYVARLDSELQEEAKTRRQQIVDRNQSAGEAVTNGDDASIKASQERIDQLTEQIAAGEKEIFDDIRDAAAKIATEKNIAAVITNVDINITAIDITDEIIKQFQN